MALVKICAVVVLALPIMIVTIVLLNVAASLLGDVDDALRR